MLREEIANKLLGAYHQGISEGESPYEEDEKELKDFLETADAILNIPEIQEMKEKAEEYKELQQMNQQLLHNNAIRTKDSHDLTLIMSNLKVREKCPTFYEDYKEGYPHKCKCKKGYISRPARAEEVAEFLDEAFLGWGADGNGEYELLSGAILYQEVK